MIATVIAPILAKCLPWLGMAVSIFAAFIGLRSSKKHVEAARAQASAAEASASIAIKAEQSASEHVQSVNKVISDVQQKTNTDSDDAVMRELRENWSSNSDGSKNS